MKFTRFLTLALTGSAAASPFSWSHIDAINDIVKRQKEGGLAAGDLIPTLEDLLKDIKDQTKAINKTLDGLDDDAELADQASAAESIWDALQKIVDLIKDSGISIEDLKKKSDKGGDSEDSDKDSDDEEEEEEEKNPVAGQTDELKLPLPEVPETPEGEDRKLRKKHLKSRQDEGSDGDEDSDDSDNSNSDSGSDASKSDKDETALGKLLKDIFGELGGPLEGTVKKLGMGSLLGFINPLGSALDRLIEELKDVVEALLDVVKELLDGLTGALGNVLGAAGLLDGLLGGEGGGAVAGGDAVGDLGDTVGEILPGPTEGADAPEEDAPEEDVPEEDAPEEDVPEEDVPEEDVPEEDAPEEDAPEDEEEGDPDTEVPGGRGDDRGTG